MTTVLWSQEADIGRITLNRPDVLNAMNETMTEELLEVLNEAGRRARKLELGAIVVTGSGRAFCAGVDVKERPTPESMHRRLFRIQTLTRRLLAVECPVVAAINGPAVGMGLELALACDMRIAAATARLGFPEVSIGVTVTNGASVLLPSLVGQGHAHELLLTGELITADRAEAIGLVSRVAPDDQVIDTALEVSRQLASRPRKAVRETRRLLRQPIIDSLDMVLYREIEALLRCVDPG